MAFRPSTAWNRDPRAPTPGELSRVDGRGGLTGWLVRFEPRKDVPWAERLYRRDVAYRGKTIKLVGC
jgi:hypothetical protein